jgi:hypothetical protein
MACAETISARRFSRGVCSPKTSLVTAKKIDKGGCLTRWSIGFQGGNNTRFGNFIWSTIVHIHGGKEENVALLSDSGGNSFHDLPIDGLFVVSHEVLIEQLLDLVG